MCTRFSIATAAVILLLLIWPADASEAANARKLVVAFRPAVSLPDAERILQSVGVTRIELPDLLPSHRLVLVTDEQAKALGRFQEVARIFPASAELARGEPVTACAGAIEIDRKATHRVVRTSQSWESLHAVELTYSFELLTTQLAPDTVVALFEKASAQWTEHAAVRLRHSLDPSAPRNINIVFASGDHGDSYPFDGKDGVLAHTFYPPPLNAEPLAGDIHLDDDETWTDGGARDLYSVILHELGHALGLGHSSRPGAVMYPYYRALSVLQPDDIAALRQIYLPPEPQVPQSSSMQSDTLSGVRKGVRRPAGRVLPTARYGNPRATRDHHSTQR